MNLWFKNLFSKKGSDSVNESVNVVQGIGKAKSLYRELIIQAHPDRHPDKEAFYKEITDRITANRYNYNELVKIRDELLSAN